MNLFWNVRWRIRSFISRLTGRSGFFAVAESSERATRLDAIWDSKWHGQLPLGHRLRGGDRWVRFHSLPNSERYAETEQERLEIFARHRAVLEQYVPDGRLTAIVADWDWGDLHGGWTRLHHPGSWPWRKAETEPGESTVYFWVREYSDIEELRPLLDAVANDEGWATILDDSGDWLYCPYDGGADLIARTAAERDRLAAQFADWLPDNPQGL